MAMTAPITALYAKALGAPTSWTAMIVASMSLSFLVVDLAGSRIVPRVDARAALWGGYVAFGVGSLASAVAPSAAAMTAARLLQGFGAAFPIGASFHYALRMARAGGAAREIAKVNAAGFVGLAVGPPIVGVVAGMRGGLEGMRWGFAVCGVVNLATAALARVLLPPLPSLSRPRLGLPARGNLRGARLRLALVASGLGFGLRGVAGMSLMPLLGAELGLGAAGVSLAAAAMAVTELAGIVASGRAADMRGRLVPVLAAAGVGAVLLVWVSAQRSLVVYVLVAGCLGLVLATLRVVPAAMVVDLAHTDEAAAIGYRLACNVGSLAIAAVVAAMVRTTGLRGGFVAASVVAATIGALVLSTGETLHADVPPGAPANEPVKHAGNGALAWRIGSKPRLSAGPRPLQGRVTHRFRGRSQPDIRRRLAVATSHPECCGHHNEEQP
jgi:MFS family permease